MLEKTLGAGTFGKVKLATHMQTKEKVAIKILEKGKMLEDQDDLERVRREIQIMKKIRHKNIIQLYEIMESKRNLYLVMENCENKELFDYIVSKKRLKEEEALKFFQQIIDGIEYIHQMNICHRDLKPENILLDANFNIKISDFGLSKIYTKSLATPCGTPSYAPPEMLKGKEYNGLKSDIWSAGIILFAMMCGYLPFSGKNEDEICNKIIECKVNLPDWLSHNSKDLLKKILTPNPESRLGLDSIRAHKFFTTVSHVKVPGVIYELHKIPVDDYILELAAEYGCDKEQLRDLIENDKFDSTTSVYYFCLKKQMRQGYTSVSDLSSEKFIDFMSKFNSYEQNVGLSENSTKVTIKQSKKKTHANSQSENIDTTSNIAKHPIRNEKLPKHEKTISDKTNMAKKPVKKPTIKPKEAKNYLELGKNLENKRPIFKKSFINVDKTPKKDTIAAKKQDMKKSFLEPKNRVSLAKTAQSFIDSSVNNPKAQVKTIDLEDYTVKELDERVVYQKAVSPSPLLSNELKRNDSDGKHILEILARKLIGNRQGEAKKYNYSVMKSSFMNIDELTEIPPQERVLERMINRQYRHFGVIHRFNLTFKNQLLARGKARKLTNTTKVIDQAEQVETSCERSVPADNRSSKGKEKMFMFGGSKKQAAEERTVNLIVEKDKFGTKKVVDVRNIDLNETTVKSNRFKSEAIGRSSFVEKAKVSF